MARCTVSICTSSSRSPKSVVALPAPRPIAETVGPFLPSLRYFMRSLLALRHFPVAELHQVAPEAMPPVLPGIELGRRGGDLGRIAGGEQHGLLRHAGLHLSGPDGLDLGAGQALAELGEIPGGEEAGHPLLPGQAGMMFVHELEREPEAQRHVGELQLVPGALDVLHLAPRGQDVASLVVGRVDLGRLLEPDVVSGVEAVRGGGGVRRSESEDRREGCSAWSHSDLLSARLTFAGGGTQPRTQSALMPVAWMMGVQRASSDFTHSPSSSGVEGVAPMPCLRKVSCVSGRRRISLTSRLILAT